jgi:5'-nucleotidase
MRHPVKSLLLLGVSLGACDVADRASDEVDDDFADDALDRASACAVLKLVNDDSEDTLAHAVRLDPRAAAGIAAHRFGHDGEADTPDDGWFGDLAALDDVDYVGPNALATMADYVEFGAYACGEVRVQVLGFNDFHGALQPPTGSSGRVVVGPDPELDTIEAGGIEYFASHVGILRTRNPDTFLVSAGDLIGATPLVSALFHDEPTIEAMNLLGLDVAGVGNHEFDRGAGEIVRMQAGGCHPVDGCVDGNEFEGADFQWLAANVEVEETGATLLPSHAIRRVGNARIAFIGLTLEDTPRIVTPSGVEGLDFLDEAETINDIVDELREDEGIETFVVLLHQGGEQQGAADECDDLTGPIVDVVERLDSAVDLVVSGHADSQYICDLDGLLVTSAASNGRMITAIDLAVDELDGDVADASAEQILVTRDVPRDADQTRLIAEYGALAAPLANRVVGRLDADLRKEPDEAGESTLGNLVADAQLEATLAADFGGAEVAFTNPGGIRADLLVDASAGGEEAGDITFAEIYAVQPFGNNLVTVTLTGAEIVELLEQQWALEDDGSERQIVLAVSTGFSYAWDPDKPIGERIVAGSVTLGGEPIADDQPVRITANAFLVGGGDGFTVFGEGRDALGGSIDLDALEAYFVDHSPVATPELGRIQVR